MLIDALFAVGTIVLVLGADIYLARFYARLYAPLRWPYIWASLGLLLFSQRAPQWERRP
jgi:hypothetical protein